MFKKYTNQYILKNSQRYVFYWNLGVYFSQTIQMKIKIPYTDKYPFFFLQKATFFFYFLGEKKQYTTTMSSVYI